MNAILTIDLEDWYHCFVDDPGNGRQYEDRIACSTQRMLDVLERTHATATFFVLGAVAKRHPELIGNIAARGHEIGSHGMRHRVVYGQTPGEFVRDLRESLCLLSRITGRSIRSYRAPFFSITKASLWALEILRDEGVRYDSSIFPVYNHRYGIARARRTPHFIIDGLFEVPPSTYRVPAVNIPFAGGAYFRLLPHFLVMRMMQSVHARQDLIVYFHPWELDEEQPRMNRYSGQGIRHYWGLSRSAGHFRNLLSRFKFSSIAGCYESAS